MQPLLSSLSIFLICECTKCNGLVVCTLVDFGDFIFVKQHEPTSNTLHRKIWKIETQARLSYVGRRKSLDAPIVIGHLN